MITARDVSQLSPLRQERLARALAGDPVCKLWLAPWRVMSSPDPWQRDALTQMVTRTDNVLMLCSRGSGKTEAFAAASFLEGNLGGFALILSRSDRQAQRIILRVQSYARKHKLVSVTRSTMHEVVFGNGGRVLALPCSGDTIVGEHGVTLLGIDEAARVTDAFYAVVTPMLGVSEQTTGIKPRLALLSTPFGKRGFFWEEWEGKRDNSWRRHKYPWTGCPRLTPEWIAQERRRHGELWVRQEYEVEFLDTTMSYFNVDAFEALIDPTVQPLANW